MVRVLLLACFCFCFCWFWHRCFCICSQFQQHNDSRCCLAAVVQMVQVLLPACLWCSGFWYCCFCFCCRFQQHNDSRCLTAVAQLLLLLSPAGFLQRWQQLLLLQRQLSLLTAPIIQPLLAPGIVVAIVLMQSLRAFEFAPALSLV